VQIDDWNVYHSGEFVAANITGVYISKKTYPELFSAQVYPLLLARSRLSGAYNYSTPTSEGSVIISSTIRNIYAALHKVQYYPTNSGASSFISTSFSWAGEPDGLFYQNKTAKGIAGALGGIMHLLYNQVNYRQQI